MNETVLHSAARLSATELCTSFSWRRGEERSVEEIHALMERERDLDLPLPKGRDFLELVLNDLAKNVPEGDLSSVEMEILSASDRLLDKAYRAKDEKEAHLTFRALLVGLPPCFIAFEERGEDIPPFLADLFLKAASLAAQGQGDTTFAVYDISNSVRGQRRLLKEEKGAPQTVDLCAQACEETLPFLAKDDIQRLQSPLGCFEAIQRPSCQHFVKTYLRRAIDVDEKTGVDCCLNMIQGWKPYQAPLYAGYMDLLLSYAEEVRKPAIVESIMLAPHLFLGKGSAFDRRIQSLWKEVAPDEDRFFSVQRPYEKELTKTAQLDRATLQL